MEDNKDKPVEYCDIVKSEGFDFRKQQEELFIQIRNDLITRLQPVVDNLVEYLRHLEKTEPGRGIKEIDMMLENKAINQPMKEILVESLANLDEDFKVDLQAHPNFNKKIGENEN